MTEAVLMSNATNVVLMFKAADSNRPRLQLPVVIEVTVSSHMTRNSHILSQFGPVALDGLTSLQPKHPIFYPFVSFW